MACRPIYRGIKLCMDCLTCGLGLGTTPCIDSHLHTLSTLEKKYKTMRYEEEMLIDLDESKSKIFVEYIGIVKQVEKIMHDPKIYGMPEDDSYQKRKELLKEFRDYLFQNPILALQTLEDYEEPFPEKSMFVQGHKNFQAWINGIIDVYSKCRLYKLARDQLDLRKAFLSILELKSSPYSQSFIKQIPKGSKIIENGEYELRHGIKAQVYKVPGSDSYLYVQKDEFLENLSDELSNILKEAVQVELKQTYDEIDFATIYDQKMREFRQHFLEEAMTKDIDLTTIQALAMGREAASWSVGLGAPIENLALDNENITDIYIDAQNAALYVEHQQFGLCHTLWQYNQKMLERAFRNIVATQKGVRKFTKDNPVVDVVLTRLAMRCHLQRPPATFGDLQAALRIMKDEPFTYPEYLKYKSFSPFFAGYDDVLVGLGCSEAVLGLKGVGKTAFTSAKISCIGTKKRILPLQDIEEIPVKAYRKRGFHIGAVRVAASDREEVAVGSSELDLVSMTNAALRMGDACVIINEIRSRTAIQGVINMLNTQPGIFLLYNLHAQSLKDIQDRLELVFGMPAASMYSTDRYSFLKKVRFGRKSRMYRMLGEQFESDLDTRQFVPSFSLQRGDDIDSTWLKCEFCDLPEANGQPLHDKSLAKIASKLKIKTIPPALKRRADETGLPVDDYMMEAFYKGKLYDMILQAYKQTGQKALLDVDFVLKCLDEANMILRAHSDQRPDWGRYDQLMMDKFNQILNQELQNYKNMLEETNQQTQKKAPRPTTKKEKTQESQDPEPLIAPEDKAPDFSMDDDLFAQPDEK